MTPDPDDTILIYPDTANLADVRDEQVADRNALLNDWPTSWVSVLTMNHVEDLAAAGDRTREEMLALTQNWPGALPLQSGAVLPAAELSRFIEHGRVDVQAIRDLLCDGWSRAESVSVSHGELHAHLDDLHAHKSAFHRAEALSKEAAKLDHERLSKSERARHRRLVNDIMRGKPLPTPEVPPRDVLEREFEAAREQWSSRIDPDLMRQGIEFYRNVDVDELREAGVPEQFVQYLQQFGPRMAEVIEGLLVGDADTVARLMATVNERTAGAFEPINPLGLTDDKRFAFGWGFCPALAQTPHRDLLGDVDTLRELFDAWWEGRPGSSPALWLQIGVRLYMDKDVRTPVGEGDAADLRHLTYAPYVDQLYADQRIVNFVGQAVRAGYGDPRLLEVVRRNSKLWDDKRAANPRR